MLILRLSPTSGGNLLSYRNGMQMDNKILIVVDVQNGFIKTQEHIEKANQIVALAKSGKFDKIVATKFLNYTGSMYEKYFNWSDLKTPDELTYMSH